MYTIIGGDGKEYGPVTAEQLRAWILAGRANEETRTKAEGSDEWKRLGDFPELAQPAAVPPAPAAPAAPVAPAAVVLPGRAKDLDVLGCYERSWALLKSDFWPLVGTSFVIFVLFMMLGGLQRKGVYFLTPLFTGVLSGGWYYYFVLKLRGQPASIGDAFSGFTRAFLNLVVIGFLVSIITTVGLILLILPGIYFLVAYAFAYVLATDKRLGIWEAMETSRRTVTRQWWRVFGLLLLGIPFALLGLAALGVGIFVTIPLIIGAIACAYEDLCNPEAVTIGAAPAASPA
jgi:hypothetical protein